MNDDPDAGRQKMMGFTKNRNRTKMDPASARRQGDIVGVALAALGNADAAMDFLNGFDTALAARPLEIATRSQEGFDKVRHLLAQR